MSLRKAGIKEETAPPATLSNIILSVSDSIFDTEKYLKIRLPDGACLLDVTI